MTATTTGPTTPEACLEDVRALAPVIAARAAEIEAARRVPRDLLDDLVRAGCFRLLMPRSHGGLGADLTGGLRMLETLARADGSVSWTVMIGGNGFCDLAGLPRATFDAVFSRPDVIVAGVINPSGRVTAVDGGYRVTGRWSFASGCEHADVLFGNTVAGVVDGAPRLRIALFAPDQVRIEDTWTTSGMCGTGSHHFRVDDVLVPAERTFDPLAGSDCLDAPIVRVPRPALFALVIAAVALGIARGALDDVLALAAGKVPLLDPAPLAANALFQHDVADADTALRAARALMDDAAGSAWARAVDGAPVTLADRAQLRAAAVWATARAAEVVTTAARVAGSSAVYADSTLLRRLRDIHTLTQHFLLKRDVLVTVGAVLAGQDPAPVVF
jgi:alkylation response protein AidB-like acyl-CoA dehydrogenase